MKQQSRLAWISLSLLALASGARAQDEPTRTLTCGVEPGPGALVFNYLGSGGMNGLGWDGIGQMPAVLTFHMEAATPDMGPMQRTQLIAALQQWAGVVNITFIEVPLSNLSKSIDFHFLTGDHWQAEPHEFNDPDCPFDGQFGTLAHAGYPPDAAGQCGGDSVESYAGNVHFDEAETWSVVVNPGDPGLDILSVATHEVGHALGLVHSAAGDIMGPTFSYGVPFPGLTANDVGNILTGYAAGPGSVVSLETSGVWVDSGTGMPWYGTSTDPFPLFTLGVGGVPPASVGIQLHVDAGTYDEPAIVIDQNMLVVAEGGSVVIR